jgi:hypothetical protein
MSYRLNTASMFSTSTINAGINSTIIGTDFRNKCFIGFSHIYYWTGNKQFFKYDISSTGTITNGSNTDPAYFDYVYALCLTNF